MQKTSLKSAGLTVAAGVLLLSGGAAFAAPQNDGGSQDFKATLTQLNGTNASGVATATVDNKDMGHFHIVVNGLIDAPHAQHVHFGKTAQHECPAKSADANGDGVLDTTEGTDAYGAVQTSLTTSGDTSPASVLAVDRSPTYAKGAVYDRTFQLTNDQAQDIRSGNGVVVVHGIDSVMPDGKYDGDLKSDLMPSLPQEATAPAACGVLAISNASSNSSNSGSSTSSSDSNNQGQNDNSAKGFSIAALVASLIALATSFLKKGRKDTSNSRY